MHGDPGPVLTLAQAAALHDRRERVAWIVLPGPGNAVIARPHTEAHDGGRWLPGHLAADGLDELRAMRPPGVRVDQSRLVGWYAEVIEWWWAPV